MRIILILNYSFALIFTIFCKQRFFAAMDLWSIALEERAKADEERQKSNHQSLL